MIYIHDLFGIYTSFLLRLWQQQRRAHAAGKSGDDHGEGSAGRDVIACKVRNHLEADETQHQRHCLVQEAQLAERALHQREEGAQRLCSGMSAGGGRARWLAPQWQTCWTSR